jgi:predicted deacylase
MIPSGETSDGAPVGIPVVIVTGTSPKPVVWVQAGVHGAELTGIVAVLEMSQSLDPSRLRGTVVLLPLVNVTAFRRWLRSSDIDSMDINRVFLGNASGAFSERVAKVLGDAVIANADYFLDVHTASAPRICPPHVIYREGAGRATAAAKRLAMTSALRPSGAPPTGFSTGRSSNRRRSAGSPR